MSPSKESRTPLLTMKGIEKSFPGVKAVKKAEIDLYPGEVHALLGENGAGKSTLIKILGGAHFKDAGHITIGGKETTITSPLSAIQHGISIIYQEFNLIPSLTISDNIFLGREQNTAGFVNMKIQRKTTLELFERMGVEIDPDTLCRNLSVAQQQIVEIAKALSWQARILIMDEPTAALTPKEVKNLFALVNALLKEGLGIIYITHRLSEVFEIAHRATVMRDGVTIDTFPIQKLDQDRLVALMVGRTIEEEFPQRQNDIGDIYLEVEDISSGNIVKNVSFAVRRGEILGITGLVGAGRTEVARLVSGADRTETGAVRLDGTKVLIKSPLDAVKNGICYLSEDRKSEGLIMGLSARENYGLPNLSQWSKLGFISKNAEEKKFARYIEALNIKIASQEQKACELSGGNQQKVVIAKWLETNSEIIIFDEPTRGIDVGAKYELYLLINRLAKQGKSIIMISSEFHEVIGMSDRILVMHEGKISGEITDVRSTTQDQIMKLAVKQEKVA